MVAVGPPIPLPGASLYSSTDRAPAYEAGNPGSSPGRGTVGTIAGYASSLGQEAVTFTSSLAGSRLLWGLTALGALRDSQAAVAQWKSSSLTKSGCGVRFLVAVRRVSLRKMPPRLPVVTPYPFGTLRHAAVAQWLEHLSYQQVDRGSSPLGGTSLPGRERDQFPRVCWSQSPPHRACIGVMLGAVCEPT